MSPVSVHDTVSSESRRQCALEGCDCDVSHFIDGDGDGVPVFEPTIAQIENFEAFLEKVHIHGIVYGAIKIATPSGFADLNSTYKKRVQAHLNHVSTRPGTTDSRPDASLGIHWFEQQIKRRGEYFEVTTSDQTASESVSTASTPTSAGVQQDERSTTPEQGIARAILLYWRTLTHEKSVCGLCTLPQWAFDPQNGKRQHWWASWLQQLVRAQFAQRHAASTNGAEEEEAARASGTTYVGRWKTTLPCRCEAPQLCAAHMHCGGSALQWYVIPPSQNEKFQALARRLAREEAWECEDFLLHQTTLFPPSSLSKNGITVHSFLQHANEFVLTFPDTFHSAFFLGNAMLHRLAFTSKCQNRFDYVRNMQFSSQQTWPHIHHPKLACPDPFQFQPPSNPDLLHIVDVSPVHSPSRPSLPYAPYPNASAVMPGNVEFLDSSPTSSLFPIPYSTTTTTTTSAAAPATVSSDSPNHSLSASKHPVLSQTPKSLPPSPPLLPHPTPIPLSELWNPNPKPLPSLSVTATVPSSDTNVAKPNSPQAQQPPFTYTPLVPAVQQHPLHPPPIRGLPIPVRFARGPVFWGRVLEDRPDEHMLLLECENAEMLEVSYDHVLALSGPAEQHDSSYFNPKIKVPNIRFVDGVPVNWHDFDKLPDLDRFILPELLPGQPIRVRAVPSTAPSPKPQATAADTEANASVRDQSSLVHTNISPETEGREDGHSLPATPKLPLGEAADQKHHTLATTDTDMTAMTLDENMGDEEELVVDSELLDPAFADNVLGSTDYTISLRVPTSRPAGTQSSNSSLHMEDVQLSSAVADDEEANREYFSSLDAYSFEEDDTNATNFSLFPTLD
ncbi:Lid2 complex subunit Jmj3 [Schizosaccharomyces japonicus yFS275]|uniref:Lid2 complex subunit Jmj3 n=1 Tax=Schizosaccharomyces japonicus (strain yFS275 / FY16936) TaxID=402676 RepID=B6K359_SCHJY|nr:Lid2 complex subunit Jmj3 [Schizosaccharomyces japonicus yFS275]EEB07916.2 Lid2 complex subunit Jmj3 [Schizosaccharomyces japonicus yFS275]